MPLQELRVRVILRTIREPRMTIRKQDLADALYIIDVVGQQDAPVS